MASLAAIAAIHDEAVKRLKSAAGRLQETTGVEAPELPQYARDPAYEQAVQLEALAEYIERVAEALTERPEEYSRLTLAELKALAVERGIDPETVESRRDGGKVIGVDIIRALEAYDAAMLPDDSAEQHPARYDEMTVAELKALAVERGIDVFDMKRKADYVAALALYDEGQVVELEQPPESSEEESDDA